MLFEERDTRSDILSVIETQFTDQPISFFWVDKLLYPKFYGAFGGAADMVILRGGKRKYWEFTGTKTT
jgi:hypothetical protein